MSHELICSWLGLPPDRWPPDHYALLGLEPGESNLERIEQQVHDRMERMRRYQLTHPEQATEGMNRLAQAFVCLTDPRAKQTYDSAMLGAPPALAPEPPPAVVVVEPPPEPPIEAFPVGQLVDVSSPPESDKPTIEIRVPFPNNKTELDWSSAPPPMRDSIPVGIPVGRLEPPAPINGVAEPVARAEPVAPPPPAREEPADPLTEAARSSSHARRGLGTKRAFYYRIARTRRLLRSWEQAGKFVGDPNRRLTRRDDAIQLGRQLALIREELRSFPPILGRAGQPGHLVMSVASVPMIVQTFLTLLPTQRETLARDWEAGRALLLAHRKFLRKELRTLRSQGLIVRSFRALHAVIADHPFILLILAAVVVLNILWPPLLDTWIFQLLVLVGLIGMDLVLQGVLSPRAWLRRMRSTIRRTGPGR